MEILTERLRIRTFLESDFLEVEKTFNEMQKTCFGNAKGFFEWLISQYKSMDIVNDLIEFGVFDKE